MEYTVNKPGEAYKTRGGLKAVVEYICVLTGNLGGYIEYITGKRPYFWKHNGFYVYFDRQLDLVGLWEEPEGIALSPKFPAYLPESCYIGTKKFNPFNPSDFIKAGEPTVAEKPIVKVQVPDSLSFENVCLGSKRLVPNGFVEEPTVAENATVEESSTVDEIKELEIIARVNDHVKLLDVFHRLKNKDVVLVEGKVFEEIEKEISALRQYKADTDEEFRRLLPLVEQKTDEIKISNESNRKYWRENNQLLLDAAQFLDSIAYVCFLPGRELINIMDVSRKLRAAIVTIPEGE